MCRARKGPKESWMRRGCDEYTAGGRLAGPLLPPHPAPLLPPPWGTCDGSMASAVVASESESASESSLDDRPGGTVMPPPWSCRDPLASCRARKSSQRGRDRRPSRTRPVGGLSLWAARTGSWKCLRSVRAPCGSLVCQSRVSKVSVDGKNDGKGGQGLKEKGRSWMHNKEARTQDTTKTDRRN